MVVHETEIDALSVDVPGKVRPEKKMAHLNLDIAHVHELVEIYLNSSREYEFCISI